MKKFPVLLLAFLSSLIVLADNDLRLSGRVKESLGKTDLCDAYILLYDSVGNVTDSIKTDMGRKYSMGEIVPTSYFSFIVPKADSTIVFDVVCEGYHTQTISYKLENVGKRERYREIPVIFMERAPRQLKEVTVTASKIKFYNKGDTIVYNADAFQLAEGSMLDALISQLPGVELDDKGQIKVNGEFVESLLLNGKEFFDGDNNLMLENIAAYTVKNVEVYKGKTKEEKYMGDTAAPKHLTMNVKLKREYMIGWIVNAQGGYGTSDRYMGRMLASWFNPTTNISVVGNINNLNDNRTPGKNDTWTPEQMPSGTKQYRMAALTYTYENPEETHHVGGNVSFNQTINKSTTSTYRTNFLPDADTYDYSFSDGNRKETNIGTNHSVYIRKESVAFGAAVSGSYIRHKNSSSSLSAAFSQEQQDMTRNVLESLYSDGTPEALAEILNRSAYSNDGWLKHFNFSFNPMVSVKIPRTSDRLYFTGMIRYEDQKEEFWTDQTINYGADPVPASRLRHFTDYSPNNTLNMNGRISYTTLINKVYVGLEYLYDYKRSNRDSYMYALERLTDMGVYGVLPDGYLAAFDPSNSYMSQSRTHTHSILPFMQYYQMFKEGTACLLINLRPKLDFSKRELDYWRDNIDHHISKFNTTLNLSSSWDCSVEYRFDKRENNYTHHLTYNYTMAPQLPALMDMIDVVSDADPLNIFRGNPDLKTQIKHQHTVRWSWFPFQKSIRNTVTADFGYTKNAQTRGYTYDTTTGVRKTSVFNVDGNNYQYFSNFFSWQFGTRKQFTLTSTTNVNFSKNNDMIGINLESPSRQKVDYNSYGEKIGLSWQFSGHNLQLRGDYTNRHTSSAQEGFNTINATHLAYGITGAFKLPKGFGISTDFTCYTRRGYGVDYLDTTDPIWNMRLSYTPPRNSRWVIMADGFDLLHRLSNVNYAVTASGRTVTYSNSLPRYFLLTVQYRLNIQPKRKNQQPVQSF